MRTSPAIYLVLEGVGKYTGLALEWRQLLGGLIGKGLGFAWGRTNVEFPWGFEASFAWMNILIGILLTLGHLFGADLFWFGL